MKAIVKASKLLKEYELRASPIVITVNEFNEKADLIFHVDVLEHISKPKKELKKAISNLNKGGRLIVSVPAFQHLYSQFDEDVGHYKRYTINIFLEEIKNIKYRSIKYYYIDSVGYFVSLFSKLFSKNYKSNFKTKIYIWNMLVKVSIIFDKIFMYNLGKSLIIIVEK